MRSRKYPEGREAQSEPRRAELRSNRRYGDGFYNLGKFLNAGNKARFEVPDIE